MNIESDIYLPLKIELLPHYSKVKNGKSNGIFIHRVANLILHTNKKCKKYAELKTSDSGS